MATSHEIQPAAAAPPLSTSAAALSGPQTAEEDSRVESPSLSTPSARARFEFERGRGNDGTKVLMVEWEDDEVTKEISGSWTVGWERKSHILPAAEERPSSPDSESSHGSTSTTPSRQTSHRLYFLLPVRKQIPATVTLTLTPTNSYLSPIVWKTNPLPAIYPPGFANDDTRGKGVLHTLWAKKRLQALEEEIAQEARRNCEGIALQMALSEKEWIQDNFGLAAPNPLSLQIKPVSHQEMPLGPMSPLSPGGSRLSEKLRGLKLQTSGDAAERSLDLPLTSPEDADVAVPLCQRKRERLVAGHTTAPIVAPKQVAAVPNPARFMTQSSSASMMSLGSVLSGQTFADPTPREEEEELFALPLSPRSPEMTKSPFSFAADDTRRYLAQSVV